MQQKYGTEQDTVNCSFYYKIGACRHGDRCTRKHIRPNFSPTVVLFNIYANPAKSGDLNIKEDHLQQHFDMFYTDMFIELSKYGYIDELVICDNICDHLVGNVFCKYRLDEDAKKAQVELDDRFYAARPIYSELSPVVSFRDALCKQHDDGNCARGTMCNFMHLKRPTLQLLKDLKEAQVIMYEELGKKQEIRGRDINEMNFGTGGQQRGDIRRNPRDTYQRRDSRPNYRDTRDTRPVDNQSRDTRTPSNYQSRDTRSNYSRDARATSTYQSRDSRPGTYQNRETRASTYDNRDTRDARPSSYQSRDTRDSRPSTYDNRDSRDSRTNTYRDNRDSNYQRDNRDGRDYQSRDRNAPSLRDTRDIGPSRDSRDSRDDQRNPGHYREASRQVAQHNRFDQRDDYDRKREYNDRNTRDYKRTRY